jgi:hypothetical protein
MSSRKLKFTTISTLMTMALLYGGSVQARPLASDPTSLTSYTAGSRQMAQNTSDGNSRQQSDPQQLDRRSRPSVNDIPRAAPAVVKRTSDYFRTFSVPRIQPRSMVDCAGSLSDFEKGVDEFNANLDTFMEGPKDERAMFRVRPDFEAQLQSQERDIDRYWSAAKAAGRRNPGAVPVAIDQDICFAKVQRAELLSIRYYAAATARLFPQSPVPVQTQSRVDVALREIGDDTAIQTLVNTNRGNATAQNRLPPPLSTNAEWIAMFRTNFQNTNPGWIYLGQSLYSSNWYIKRNEATGVAEYRQIGTRIAAKAPNGECSIITFDLYEPWTGAGFGRGRFEQGSSSAAVCANLR